MSKNPEVALACAVIEAALTEACPPHRKPGLNVVSSGYYARTNERMEAWAFLTDTAGAWARSREEWCVLAGVDPSAVRRAALARGKHPVLVEAEQHRQGVAA